MALKIYWSPEAKEQLDSVLEYLLNNWDEKVIRQFSSLLEESLSVISNFPDAFPLTNKRKQLRKCVISKHHSLFYHHIKNSIEISSLFDNRQSPLKLNLL